MARTISVGQLRQNPTRLLREVQAGATYTVTDHGRSVAAVVPRSEHRWVPIEEVAELLRTLGDDDSWRHEISEQRRGEQPSDPWDDPR
jgi:prevent-host-death family protein